MRIPVSKADLDEGRFTKIARSLKKLWPGELSLMQAQNTLAGVLGYRNLHDLQANTSDASQSSPPLISRQSIVTAAAWRLARRLQLPLLDAATLATKLHLEGLVIDARTYEAASDRAREAAQNQGKLILVDEAWSLLQEKWNPKNPMLLGAGIPGYSFAVLPDGLLFRWSVLEELVNRLPAHYLDDLAQEAQYTSMAPAAIQNAFLANELYPQACTSMPAAIKASQIRPEGFSIIWLFDRNCDCIGRALRNDAIGGIIPAIYGADDDDIFEAMGILLKGETITAPEHMEDSGGQIVYTMRYAASLGYDFPRDIQRAVRMSIKSTTATRPDLELLTQLPQHIAYIRSGNGPALHGQTFIERGQVYLRAQEWVTPADIPELIIAKSTVPSNIREGAHNSYLGSRKVMPEAAIALFDLAKDQAKELLRATAQALYNEDGIVLLLEFVLQTVEPATFDANCDRDIDDALPTHYEGEAEHNLELVRERERELASLSSQGEEIKRVIAGLARYKNTSLGLVLLLLHGEYAGSRYSGFVNAPKPGDHQGIAQLLAGVLYHAQALATQSPAPERAPDTQLLVLAVHRVVTGAAALHQLLPTCKALVAHSKQMQDQAKFMEGVEDWQRKQDVIVRLRGDGQLLYVGRAIARERPKSLVEVMMGYGRSTNVVTQVAAQTMPIRDGA